MSFCGKTKSCSLLVWWCREVELTLGLMILSAWKVCRCEKSWRWTGRSWQWHGFLFVGCSFGHWPSWRSKSERRSRVTGKLAQRQPPPIYFWLNDLRRNAPTCKVNQASIPRSRRPHLRHWLSGVPRCSCMCGSGAPARSCRLDAGTCFPLRDPPNSAR